MLGDCRAISSRHWLYEVSRLTQYTLSRPCLGRARAIPDRKRYRESALLCGLASVYRRTVAHANVEGNAS